MTTTTMAQPASVKHGWWVIDASDLVVGRLATQIASILRGKHRADYTPHVDTGDFVVVINTGKVRFTGRKLETKEYQSYSGYPGGQKRVRAKDLIVRRPDHILMEAVRRMVPRTRLGRQQMTKLKLFAGATHPHQAQQPRALTPQT